uniref:Uncharacterized LOC111853500 n=1 Tax=Paramormyrops kingsleyae TaxID=1676925 RepID=A0A3B3QCQ5_9TELE|nr:uncharacterized protein LOC111853500 [Paramormyrops kingsleyae]
MNSLEEWLVENKSKIEKGVELVGEGCEVLAATVGKLHPLLEAVFRAAAQIIHSPGSAESRYLTEQFRRLDQKLAGVSQEVDSITRELQRVSINKQNFDYEAQMISQYEKFQDFVNATEFQQKKMEKFLRHFENTGADLNLDAIYGAVTGSSGEPLLETVLAIEQRSRRAVEEFCSGLKKLFIMGIIAVMGHAALNQGEVGEELVSKWQERMGEVERRMKAAVDDCKENFAVQAKMDVEHHLLDKEGSVNRKFIEPLLTFLDKKYDWVAWSVLVFKHKEHFPLQQLAGKEYLGISGSRNFFDIVTKDNIRMLVSFSVEPVPIDKSQIQDQIEGQPLKGKMADVAQSLSDHLPSCAVYAISRTKSAAESNTFPDDCYYYESHKKAHFCIHSK